MQPLLSTAATGATGATTGRGPTPAADLRGSNWAAERSAADSVLAVVGQEKDAVQNGDLGAYRRVLSEDASFLCPDGRIRRGLDLMGFLREFLDCRRVRWLRSVSKDVVVIGDLAYHEHEYACEMAPRLEGRGSIISGRAVHVLRLQRDGSWKIAKKIWDEGVRRDSATGSADRSR